MTLGPCPCKGCGGYVWWDGRRWNEHVVNARGHYEWRGHACRGRRPLIRPLHVIEADWRKEIDSR